MFSTTASVEELGAKGEEEEVRVKESMTVRRLQRKGEIKDEV